MPLIDCANFYRALHKAICQAQRSIFIVGWELDSTVRLLRGEDEKATEIPSIASELLAWKAAKNPQLKIYLLRWDSSLAFIDDRELMAERNWAANTPENVHICLDNVVPVGGSQHQKIILIDDELAFSGGMDLARQRWDEREHRFYEPERTDLAGPYGPYHDVQVMMDGPIVTHLAELVRWRWSRAAGYPALPVQNQTKINLDVVPTWPKNWPVLFKDIECAIARTLPRMEDHPAVQEVYHMYLDLISQAENFIYIENQFATHTGIAQALNKQLKLKTKLQVLLISSYNPQGLFENKGLWTGRIDFKNCLYEGVESDRVKMVYTKIQNSGGELACKRIHSKILVVDDKYFVVGSANIANRSMSLDSECDIAFIGDSIEKKQQIVLARNDLIAEHTGRSLEEVEKVFSMDKPIVNLLKPIRFMKYHLQEIDDSQFTDKSFQFLQKFADPPEPLISLSPHLTNAPLRNPKKNLFLVGALLFVFGLFISAFLLNQRHRWLSAENIQLFLNTSRQSQWAFPIVCLSYILGGFVLFPVTILSLLTAAAFGPFWGPLYAMGGALSSGAVMFGIGHLAGFKLLRRVLGERIRKLDYCMKEAGIWGIALIRFLPLAPYSLVNLAAGMSSVRFIDFLIGSFLGFLPASVVKGFLGDALVQSVIKPNPQTKNYLILGVLGWLALVIFSIWIAKRWRRRTLHEV